MALNRVVLLRASAIEDRLDDFGDDGLLLDSYRLHSERINWLEYFQKLHPLLTIRKDGLQFRPDAEARNHVLLEFLSLRISFQFSFLRMFIECLLNLLYDFAIELALPLGGVSLCFVSNTSKHALPFLLL
jgi:hypothetical protein